MRIRRLTISWTRCLFNNDWIEGARRLKADDSSGWAEGRAEQKKVEEKTPKVEGPPVGTMQAVREIQSECLADDLPVGEHMKEWSEERLRDYFENGGESV